MCSWPQTRCQKSLRVEKLYALCTPHCMWKEVKSVVWQFNKIKILTKTSSKLHLYFGHYITKAMILNVSWILSITARQTRYCRVEPGKTKDLQVANQVKTCRFCFSLPLVFVSVSKPRQTMHDLCWHWSYSHSARVEQAKNILLFSSYAQRILLVLVATHLSIFLSV